MTLAISQLVPHRGRMCWLDEVTHLEPARRSITCGATVRDDNPLLERGRLPAWALLELVAQAAAALRGSAAAPERGYLVAVRDATFSTSVAVGDRLVVEARLVDERGVYRYLEGEVRSAERGATLCRAALSVVLESGSAR